MQDYNQYQEFPDVDVNKFEVDSAISKPYADLENSDISIQSRLKDYTKKALEERFKGSLPQYKGTYFYGGAGFNGGYIVDMISELKSAGVSNVYSGHNGSSGGKGTYDSPDMQSMTDAASVTFINQSGSYRLLGTNEFKTVGVQFNLIGYSYGAIIAAVKAISYATLYSGTVDHLVLIGAPIESSLLEEAKATSGIKKVVVVDLGKHVPGNDDPIFAGISDWGIITSVPELQPQQGKGTGHFWYAPAGPEGQKRRRELAIYIFSQGVR